MVAVDRIGHHTIERARDFKFGFTLPAGATTATGVFTVTPVQDDVVEPADSDANRLTLRIDDGLKFAVPEPGVPVTTFDEVILTLIDDDSPGPDVGINQCANTSAPLYISFNVRGSSVFLITTQAKRNLSSRSGIGGV